MSNERKLVRVTSSKNFTPLRTTAGTQEPRGGTLQPTRTFLWSQCPVNLQEQQSLPLQYKRIFKCISSQSCESWRDHELIRADLLHRPNNPISSLHKTPKLHKILKLGSWLSSLPCRAGLRSSRGQQILCGTSITKAGLWPRQKVLGFSFQLGFSLYLILLFPKFSLSKRSQCINTKSPHLF